MSNDDDIHVLIVHKYIRERRADKHLLQLDSVAVGVDKKKGDRIYLLNSYLINHHHHHHHNLYYCILWVVILNHTCLNRYIHLHNNNIKEGLKWKYKKDEIID